MNTYQWLIRREFWENRGGFLWAPTIAGGVFILLNVMALIAFSMAAGRAHIQIGAVKLDSIIKTMDDKALAAAGAGIDATLYIIAALIGVVAAIVVFFYSLGSLYDERRDRSILFWKSLPLSDRDTVLSKAISATVLAPAIGAAAGLVTGLLFLLLLCVYGLFHGQNLFGLVFSTAHPFQVAATLIASLPVAALWGLPTVGWLMLCSVWARSKPFLWAVGIPVALGIMSYWFDLMKSLSLPSTWFWEKIVGRALFSVMPGSWIDERVMQARFENLESPTDFTGVLTLSDVFAPLGRMDLWIGAAVGAAMIIAAIRIRRWRDDG